MEEKSATVDLWIPKPFLTHIRRTVDCQETIRRIRAEKQVDLMRYVVETHPSYKIITRWEEEIRPYKAEEERFWMWQLIQKQSGKKLDWIESVDILDSDLIVTFRAYFAI